MNKLKAGCTVIAYFCIGFFSVSQAADSWLIIPQPAVLVEQQRCLGQAADSVNCARIHLSVERSGVDWLDQLLLQRATAGLDVGAAPLTQKAIRLAAENWLDARYVEIEQLLASDARSFMAHELSCRVDFLYQRGHLASFKQFDSSFSGGAHGIYATRFLLFDLQQQRLLSLQDILLPDAEPLLAAALLEQYQQRYPEQAQSWLQGTQQEQFAELMTDNFIFNEQGLVFSYTPYHLGPYAVGEVRLVLPYFQLDAWVKPEFLPGA